MLQDYYNKQLYKRIIKINKNMYQSSMYKKEFKDVFLNIKVLKKFTYKKPLIIDVGSNEGQSITEFKKTFF